MTSFFLIRHGAHAVLDQVLLGRTDSVGLSEEGKVSVRHVAEELLGAGIACIHTSPRLRCRQTAELLASCWRVPVEVAPDLDELDYGRWSGIRFSDLESDPLWHRWNEQRDEARPPDGECMGEVQQRVFAYLTALITADPEGRIAVVSHAEVIRAVLLQQYGIPLREFWRVAVEPAQVFPITWTGNRLEAA